MARFLSDPGFLALTRLNTSAPCCNEALHSPMIVAVGLLGPLPRSDSTLQATYTLGTCQTSMMCCQRCGQILSDPEILTLTRLNISAPSCNEALYPPMIVGVGLLGPIPRSDNPSQDTYTLSRNMADINDVLPKMWPDFCQILKFLPLQDSISVHHLAMRHCSNEALYSPMIVAVGLLGPLSRSYNPSQATYILGTCHTTMMCCKRCGKTFVRS